MRPPGALSREDIIEHFHGGKEPEELKVGDRVTIVSFGVTPLVSGILVKANELEGEVLVKVRLDKNRVPQVIKSKVR